ncbi:MAG: nuclear transport factor 2 family protein, partial [Myxococcales bacterium]|nr:nuclear transport factor 2 family protein [Myxococcales bacterium]
HAIHEELRAMVADASQAIGARQYDRLLPLLSEDFEGTSLTQASIRGRDGVKDYFDLWFGPEGYMESMSIEMRPDALTDLSEDKSWGLVSGSGKEHYVAKNGDTFDFDTRWTTVVVREDDGKWRVRAVHFGTNHLDNPVLFKVRDSMLLYGGLGALAVGLGCFGLGFGLGRRRRQG